MADIIVFGATGYTGRLAVQYLYNHPQRPSFTLGICARSRGKVAELRRDLDLDSSVKVFYADVTQREEVEAVVKEAKVVINAVGPYWRWGTPVVRACAENGIHYVDLSGETHWIREVILQVDYLASKTHAIIIPAAGFDSVPSDLAVYLSNKTLKALAGPDAEIEESVSAFELPAEISGGSYATMLCAMSEVPRNMLQAGQRDYALSTGIHGTPSPPPKLLYRLPFSAPPIFGGLYIMAGCNRAIVQRTWGIYQMRASDVCITEQDRKDAHLRSYGPKFKYDEFMVKPNQFASVMLSISLAVSFMFMAFPPFRWIISKFLPQPGDGPSEHQIQHGYLHIINMTTSVPTPTKPPTHVRTTIHGKGDAGYALAAVMLAESALSLLLSYSELTHWVKDGGVFTPASALSDVLVKRLEASGRMTFESEVVLGPGEESRKTR